MAVRLLLLLGAWMALVGASGPVLVPDISSRNVEIRTSFTGEELLLFGAIIYEGGLPDAPAEVAVVLRGPSEPILLREKQKVAGIWVNADSHRFRSVPGFYALASSAPIDRLIDARTAAIYEIGVDNLQLSPGPGAAAEKEQRMEAGLIDRMEQRGLYAETPTGVEITDNVLYRARISIPSRVPVGVYRAETFLISEGRVLAVATREISIGKSGFERFVALAAERHGFLYGIAAILVSLFLGWAAAAIFRKRV
ncbi:TIGR02186 family protein [Sphingomicrobium sediminis]|uniref:TIGR02186 family protein n=1 Tax=Sphingomicrobium sediminis TaxID=2950949 RepID=A0A9X2EME0_9SPHN|nr:TIGR02186 family protein [Sphingomicrobium sediminis]MCM8557972.1 TIGR02186 family protein [Sphingomicrobium sediminis]